MSLSAKNQVEELHILKEGNRALKNEKTQLTSMKEQDVMKEAQRSTLSILSNIGILGGEFSVDFCGLVEGRGLDCNS